MKEKILGLIYEKIKPEQLICLSIFGSQLYGTAVEGKSDWDFK